MSFPAAGQFGSEGTIDGDGRPDMPRSELMPVDPAELQPGPQAVGAVAAWDQSTAWMAAMIVARVALGWDIIGTWEAATWLMTEPAR